MADGPMEAWLLDIILWLVRHARLYERARDEYQRVRPQEEITTIPGQGPVLV
jgi:hypothetical protein